MKNLFAIMLLFFCTYLSAQEKSLEFGAKVGLNISSISNYSDNNDEARKSLLIGGFLEMPINEKFSFAPELLYSSQGENSKFEILEGKFKSITQLDYIILPLIVKYYLIDGLAIEAGPQIGFLVNADQILESDGSFTGDFETIADENFNENFSNFDAGLDFGASYKLPFNLIVQARYSLGIVDINNSNLNNNKIRNNVLQLAVGYSF